MLNLFKLKKYCEKETGTITTIEQMIKQLEKDRENCKNCAFVINQPAKYKVTSDKEVVTVLEEEWRCIRMDKDNNELNDFKVCSLFKSIYE